MEVTPFGVAQSVEGMECFQSVTCRDGGGWREGS